MTELSPPLTAAASPSGESSFSTASPSSTSQDDAKAQPPPRIIIPSFSRVASDTITQLPSSSLSSSQQPLHLLSPSGSGVSSSSSSPPPPPPPASASPSCALVPYHLAYLHSWPLMGAAAPGLPPAPIPPLDFDHERDLLLHCLSESQRALRLHISHATTQQLLKLLIVGCRVLHYSGHGMPTCLAFETESGDMQAVDTATLHRMLTPRRTGDGVQLVFVSACHSESTASAFLAAGVRHVIAVRAAEQVHDQAAQRFLHIFYYSLFCGKTVRDSYETAKVSVLTGAGGGALEDRKFLLLPADGQHDVVIYGDDVPLGAWQDLSEGETRNNLAANELFLGRNAEMQEIVHRLVKKRRRLLTLTGAAGVGKTALAIAAATYLCKRHAFDGIYCIDCIELQRRPGATLATLCSEAMQLPTVINSTAHLCQQIRGEKLLFIFDEAESCFAFPPASPRCLSSFLAALLSLPPVRALLTSLSPLHPPLANIQEAVLAVQPLSPNDSVRLFYNLWPRKVEPAEFGCLSLDSVEMGRALRNHRVLLMLAGIPRRIWRAETMLGAGGLRMDEQRLLDAIKLMIRQEDDDERSRRERYADRISAPAAAQHDLDHDNGVASGLQQRTARRASASSSFTPPHAAAAASLPTAVSTSVFSSPLAAAFWLQHAGSSSSIPYSQLEPALRRHFVAFCRTPSRPLSLDDLHVLRRKMEAMEAEAGSGAGGSGIVTPAAFDRFWPWFSALELTVLRCARLWSCRLPALRPRDRDWPASSSSSSASSVPPSHVPALHGFLTREQSAALLLSVPRSLPHPFLLRLSETHPACLTVVYVRAAAVTFTLIHVGGGQDGEGREAEAAFSIDLDTRGARRVYPSLGQLVLDWAAFQTLYPNVSKTDVFANYDDAAADAEDDADEEEEAEYEEEDEEEDEEDDAEDDDEVAAEDEERAERGRR